MDLWNDYEGKTIAGKFLLEKLLYPEGRNGFFATNNGSGRPAVIRVTESMNDQEETLEQWRIVHDLNHPNLVMIKSYGQVVMDDSPLVYAVLEAPDATLAEMLKERKMTVDETREIAASLIPALDALHSAGLTHGCLEPASVVAIGEVVKLRSDCVRKLPEGQDGIQRKAVDVQCLVTLLSQALTRQRTQQGVLTSGSICDAIVDNGIAGTWGLKEISQALIPPAASLPVTAQVETSHPEKMGIDLGGAPDADSIAPMDTSTGSQRSAAALAFEEGQPWPRRTGPWVVLGLAVALLFVIAYFVFRGSPKQSARNQSSAPASTTPVPATQAIASPNQAVSPAPAANPPSANGVSAAKQSASDVSQVWRVVAYTYNKRDQAENKVRSIERRHNSFKPEVFTPTGSAPFLITLGGAMNHEEAIALKRKAQVQGFPRDTYAQNYSAK